MAAVGARAAGVLGRNGYQQPSPPQRLVLQLPAHSNGEASRMARFNPDLALTFFFADLLRFFTCKSSTTTTTWLLLMRSEALCTKSFRTFAMCWCSLLILAFPFFQLFENFFLRASRRSNLARRLACCCNGAHRSTT